MGVPVLERIRAGQHGLRPAEAKVAELVRNEPEAVVSMSVGELAERVGVSVASVVRCCQSLGFEGYPELKLTLAQELVPAHEQLMGDVLPDDDAATVAARVLGESAAALSEAIRSVDPDALDELGRLVTAARRVLIAGVGTSAPVAADAAYRLATIGIDATAPPDVHVQHVTARLLRPEDLCIAVSHTGATTETVAVAEAARSAGAKVAVITSFSDSALTRVADVVVVGGSRETAYRVEAMASRLVHVAMVDVLVVLVARAGGASSAAAASAAADVVRSHRK